MGGLCAPRECVQKRYPTALPISVFRTLSVGGHIPHLEEQARQHVPLTAFLRLEIISAMGDESGVQQSLHTLEVFAIPAILAAAAT